MDLITIKVTRLAQSHIIDVIKWLLKSVCEIQARGDIKACITDW